MYKHARCFVLQFWRGRKWKKEGEITSWRYTLVFSLSYYITSGKLSYIVSVNDFACKLLLFCIYLPLSLLWSITTSRLCSRLICHLLWGNFGVPFNGSVSKHILPRRFLYAAFLCWACNASFCLPYYFCMNHRVFAITFIGFVIGGLISHFFFAGSM